jgi:hypothetical protein
MEPDYSGWRLAFSMALRLILIWMTLLRRISVCHGVTDPYVRSMHVGVFEAWVKPESLHFGAANLDQSLWVLRVHGRIYGRIMNRFDLSIARP